MTLFGRLFTFLTADDVGFTGNSGLLSPGLYFSAFVLISYDDIIRAKVIAEIWEHRILQQSLTQGKKGL